MKILPRYILKEAVSYFLIALVIFTGILFTLRVLKLTSLIINKGVAFNQVTSVFLAIIPTFMEIAVPLAALLGVMLTFARLSGDSEIIVIRASGISLFQLIKPVLYFGIFAAAIGLYVSHELKPWGYQKLSKTLFEIARTKSTAGLEPGVFNQLGTITLYAEEVDGDNGHLKDIIIDDQRQEGEGRVITAERGTILSDPIAQTITFHLEQGEIHEVNDGKYVLTRYVTNDLVTNSDALYGDNKERRRRSRELTWSELRNEQNKIEKTLSQNSELVRDTVPFRWLSQKDNKNTDEELREELEERRRKIRFERQIRFSLPLASLLLALVGMTLGIQSPRSRRTWGAGLSVLIGLLVFLGYFALFSLSKTLAESGVGNPLIVAWIPDLILLAIGAYFLRQMSTERWQTISESVEFILTWIKDITSRKKRPATT